MLHVQLDCHVLHFENCSLAHVQSPILAKNAESEAQPAK